VTQIAFLGTGLMGAPMVRNLLAAGHDVSVWNRTSAKAEALADDGARVCTTAAEAVAGCEVVISMLADGAVTGAVLDDGSLQAGLARGALWIDMCSAKPDEARVQARLVSGLGCGHIDAPVSGGTRGAEAGTLAIMAGGAPEDFARAEPVLSVMGRPVHVGPTGAGQLAKLANQAIVAIAIGAVAEAMLLVAKGGGDPAAVREALTGGFADSTVLQQHGARMTEGNFSPGGFARLHLKDLTNAMAEAEALGLTLPMTHELRRRFDRLCNELGGSELDHSALYLELLSQNGLGGEVF
jgi:2-hydroxy-3-oxopropionate reductase